MRENYIWTKILERAKSTPLKPYIDNKMYSFKLESGKILVKFADPEHAEAYLDGWIDAKRN